LGAGSANEEFTTNNLTQRHKDTKEIYFFFVPSCLCVKSSFILSPIPRSLFPIPYYYANIHKTTGGVL
jgi:hypothetical protein